jgi:type VI secretion system protein VasJ
MMELADLGKEPIAGNSPTGSDCRYEETFEALQAEIDKAASPTASGKINWDEVVKLSAAILETQSKDLTVASYLAVGLLHSRQLDGLEVGIQVLKDLVTTYWDKLYPTKKRMRGRVGAFTWWLEKTEDALKNREWKPIPAEQQERMIDDLKGLDAELVEKMPDPPLLRPVQRHVEQFAVVKKEVPAPAEAPLEPAEASVPGPQEAPQAATQPQPTAAPPAAAAPQKPETDKDARKTIDTCFKQLRQTSQFLLGRNPKDPAAYRYRRVACWAEVESLPQHTEGATRMPPPPPQLLAQVTAAREEANWLAVINSAEPMLYQMIFWFDLSFWTAEALQHLGTDYKAALEAVCFETAYLLQRFPDLIDFSFVDGTPFADSSTKQWLGAIRFGDGGGAPTRGDAASETYTAAVQEAMQMARKKKLVEAIGLLQSEMRQAPSPSMALRWRLAITNVLLAVKQIDHALAHVDRIIDEIDTFKLEQWDPHVALDGLSAAWKGYSANKNIPAHQERAAEILKRIAGLDPAQALRLGK